MTDKERTRAGKARYTDAHAAAQSMSKDPGVKAQQGAGDAKVIPRNQDRNVTESIRQEKLKCPRCGEPALHAEFPDQFEAWVKCPSCDFFMGMSNEEWHRMENSPNINEKKKKWQRSGKNERPALSCSRILHQVNSPARTPAPAQMTKEIPLRYPYFHPTLVPFKRRNAGL